MKINKEKKKELASLYLIYEMHKNKKRYSILLNGNDKYLESIFEHLLSKDCIVIDNNDYAISQKGREVFNNLMKRYTDFIITYDVYSAVDLAKGEFAFEQYYKIEDEKSWENYLEQERFEDLRITIAIYKGIDPIDMVLISFLHEGKLSQNFKEEGWQFDLISGKIWKEIINIINLSIKIKHLAYQEENSNFVSGEDVLKDIINQGARLNQVLWQNESKYLKEEYPDISDIDENIYKEHVKNEKFKDDIWLKKYF